MTRATENASTCGRTGNRAVVLEVALASLLAWLVSKRVKTGQEGDVSAFPVWWSVFHRAAPPKTDVMLSIRTHDGETFSGMLKASSVLGDVNDRDLALEAPVEVKRNNGSVEVIDDPWRIVIVPAAEIAEIAVGYRSRG
jgi:hypothetical protein